MALYGVSMNVVVSVYKEVRAKSKEDAIELAYDNLDCEDICEFCGYEDDDIHVRMITKS